MYWLWLAIPAGVVLYIVFPALIFWLAFRFVKSIESISTSLKELLENQKTKN